MIPESLVSSMLDPEKFGSYLATGTQKRTHGQAIYFDLKRDFQSEHFDLSLVEERCKSHPNGELKHSVYLAIYRVLELLPLEVISNLWLATKDGRVLELEQSEGELPDFKGKYHLYQEICPTHPLIASTLSPDAFCKFITDKSHPVHVPRICFVDLELGELADDPIGGQTEDLPYSHIEHLRDCLTQLEKNGSKPVKTVNRIQPQDFPYRCIKNGFYVGDQEKILYYPFPSHKTLDSKYHNWWRSANI